MTEVYRSRDSRWSIYREVDRYVIYDENRPNDVREVWSCRTLTELYDWMARNGLSIADFDEVA